MILKRNAFAITVCVSFFCNFVIMMERAEEIVNDISKLTDSVILCHSLSGKDSIALLNLLYPHFKRIVCMFMYTVPNLRHIQKYYIWAKKNYPRAEFIQVPHYCVFNYRKYGFMGREGDERQRLFRLSDIIDKVREKTGIEWVCLGFKQSDSLNRRLMLRSYKEGKLSISYAGKKFYPLSTYKNRDVFRYIEERRLKSPEVFDRKEQSSGVDVTDVHYLNYLRVRYPDDLQKVIDAYPAVLTILQNETERDKDSQEK